MGSGVLILYTKQGCCLCEGLEAKLRQLDDLPFTLELRDIMTNPEWCDRFQYEVPVLYWQSQADTPAQPIPRPSPRASVADLRKVLHPYLPRKIED